MLSQGPGLARNEAEASVASRSAVERQPRPKPCRRLASGPRSRGPTQAAELHRGIQSAHPARSRGGGCHPRRHRRPSPSRRSVLFFASQLAARASQRDPGGLDSAEARAEVQAPSPGRRNAEAARQNARLNEELRKAHIIIDVQKKVAALLGHPIPDQDLEKES